MEKPTVIAPSLLQMDEMQLVQLYAQKLTLLTKKQRVIFDLLASGMMVKEIAKHIGVAEITVKVTKAKIMTLLGVTSLQELSVIGKCTACQYIKQSL